MFLWLVICISWCLTCRFLTFYISPPFNLFYNNNLSQFAPLKSNNNMNVFCSNKLRCGTPRRHELTESNSARDYEPGGQARPVFCVINCTMSNREMMLFIQSSPSLLTNLFSQSVCHENSSFSEFVINYITQHIVISSVSSLV